jgi:hypothetical protein
VICLALLSWPRPVGWPVRVGLVDDFAWWIVAPLIFLAWFAFGFTLGWLFRGDHDENRPTRTPRSDPPPP